MVVVPAQWRTLGRSSADRDKNFLVLSILGVLELSELSVIR